MNPQDRSKGECRSAPHEGLSIPPQDRSKGECRSAPHEGLSIPPQDRSKGVEALAAIGLLRLQVNGRTHTLAAPDSALLIEVLRDTLGLSGTKQGCDGGECGACTVLVDGAPRLACITLAVSVQDRTIETIEGLACSGRMSRLQQAFHENLGTQCGFCTPGMVMASEALLRSEPHPDTAQIRAALAGNLCRCTGYVKIIESVQAASRAEP